MMIMMIDDDCDDSQWLMMIIMIDDDYDGDD